MPPSLASVPKNKSSVTTEKGLGRAKDILQAARELCDRHKALLIFDEVQCGSGRTGELFAYMKYAVTPDILSTAKGIGGGFPLGVMLTTKDIAASFAVGAHGSTYGGNPLACAVGLAVLNIISAPETLRNVVARHQQIVAGLNELKRKYQVFKEIRGDGLLIGAELSEKWKGRGKEFVKMAEKHGLMLLIAGPDVMRIAPSLLITQDDVEQGLKRFDATVAELLAAETALPATPATTPAATSAAA